VIGGLLGASGPVVQSLTGPKFWWYVTRATGLVAWAVAAASVLWGLVLSTRSARGMVRPAWVLDLHRFLGGLTILVLGVHIGSIAADSFVHFGLADLFVPGHTPYKTTAIALGIVALWLLLLIEVTSLLRRRLPKRLWSVVHLSSFAVYVLATFHFVLAGTERTNPAVLLVVETTSAAVLFFTLVRILVPRRPALRAVPALPQRDRVAAHGGE